MTKLHHQNLTSAQISNVVIGVSNVGNEVPNVVIGFSNVGNEVSTGFVPLPPPPKMSGNSPEDR
jgi:hypothetical protein